MFDITLTLRVAGHANTESPEDLAHLSEVLSRNEWSDGRYPYAVEAVQHGLAQMLQRAVAQVVWEQAVTRYPTNDREDVLARRQMCDASTAAVTVGCDITVTVRPGTEERECP